MSGQKVTKSSKDVAATNGSVSATMKKAFKKDSTWEDKVYIYTRRRFLLPDMISWHGDLV